MMNEMKERKIMNEKLVMISTNIPAQKHRSTAAENVNPGSLFLNQGGAISCKTMCFSLGSWGSSRGPNVA